MVEVPEHLLERSKERRRALGDTSVSEPAAASSSEPEVASTAPAPAPAVPAKTPVPMAPAEPKPEPKLPPQVIHSASRRRIPYWVMPILLFLPIWAFIYVGTLEEPAASAEGILAEGHTVYFETASCATCHGAEGAGSNAGPSLKESELLTTFLDDSDGIGFAQQVEWVVKGTERTGVGTPYGNPGKGRVAGWFGTMAAFGDQLSARDVLAVVLHERAMLSESETALTQASLFDQKLANGEIVLPEKWSPDVTAAEILEILGPALTPSEETPDGSE